MNNRNLILMFLVLTTTAVVSARVTTSRKGLTAIHPLSNVITEPDDSLQSVEAGKFTEGAVTMLGFAKRASDAKETFFLTNRTAMHISLVEILIRYSDMKGATLHERTVTVSCDLPAYSTRQVSVKTFDAGREFYYYLSSKPRKVARPFQVAAKILRYDVVQKR